MSILKKIGLGGGCHWCTEAVFQALKGVEKVEQGYISSVNEAASFSEAVVVHYDPEIISLQELISVHIFTHRSTSNHSFRRKYRSAIYTSEENEFPVCENILQDLQKEFSEKINTQILPLKEFKPSRESLWDYYKKNPEKPFCKKYIHPKMRLLQKNFPKLKKED
ncbi:peptide-methionine (S)-S-oxide reductase [Salinimicrobium gaetbulicola]|uniref:peptide-methionine (S)-S-oxide reductase n=1 Tax=Salinimicrobium gaetbulicola TaxID=999702 RepID=A0ABW3IIC9_9FLAO